MADEKIIEEQEFENINSVEVEQKVSWLDKTKTTAKKVWNSKPGKVVKTIGLVAIGAVGALALSNRPTNDYVDPEEIMDCSDDVVVTEI